MFTLESTAQHKSVLAKTPPGWTSQLFTVGNRQYKKAIDKDGCCWYWNGGWVLNVPGFDGDGNAVVESVNGTKKFPISESGVIRINGRRILPGKWDH